jgi:hypothetical protein
VSERELGVSIWLSTTIDRSIPDLLPLVQSDHGEMNMEHRQVWKNSLYEVSVQRVCSECAVSLQ